MAVLAARGVSVRRGRRTVLEGVDLALPAGRALTLTGANGAGKTSLLRVLAGLAAPAAGRLDRPASAAFVPDRVVLAPALRCGEWLTAMRRLRGLDAPPRRWPVLEQTWLDRPAADLSRGERQRLALAEALTSGAQALLLDEPFAGLDAAGRDRLAEALAACLAAGAAVALSDHEGAAAMLLEGTHLAVLDGGRCEVVAGGASASGGGGGAGGGVLPAAGPGAGAEPGGGPVTVVVLAAHPDGRRLERTVPAGASDDLLRDLLAAGWHVEAVTPR